jgi:hypothetical protein
MFHGTMVPVGGQSRGVRGDIRGHIRPLSPTFHVLTDVSNFGWEAHVNEVDLTTKGTWSQEESMMSINILELKAVLLGVKHFRHRLRTRECLCFQTIPQLSGLHSKTERYPLPSSQQNDMGTSPVLPSRKHHSHLTAHTGEAQHTCRRPFQIEQVSVHRVDTTHGRSPSSSRSVWLSDIRSICNENEQSSPAVHVTSARSESVGSERLGRIMGWHECLRIDAKMYHK